MRTVAPPFSTFPTSVMMDRKWRPRNVRRSRCPTETSQTETRRFLFLSGRIGVEDVIVIVLDSVNLALI